MPTQAETIVWTAFAYTANVFHKRIRTDENVRLRGAVPIQVSTLDAADAPVAIRVSHKNRYDPARRPRPERETVEMRWDGARLLVPMLGPEGKPMTAPEFERAMSGEGMIFPGGGQVETPWSDNPLLDYYKTTGGGVEQRHPLFALPTREECAGRVRTWVADDMAQQAEATRTRAARLAVVDGIVHRQCPEPTWQAWSHWIANAVAVSFEEPEPSDHILRFRLDAGGDALRFMELLGQRQETSDQVEILMPDAIRRDPLELNARSLFECVSPHLVDQASRLARGGAARAWSELRDAEADFRDGDREALHAAYAALRRMVDADWTPSPMAKAEGSPERAMPFLMAYEAFHLDRPLDDEAIAALAP